MKQRDMTPQGKVHRVDDYGDDPLECVGCGILAGAALAKWNQMQRTYKKKNRERIGENIFIARLVNKSGQWDEGDVVTIQRLSKSKDFRERFARALEHGRAPIFDDVDIFILRNWFCWNDTIDGAPEIADKPGLADWTPRAACALMLFAGLSEAEHSESWYSLRRKRLALPGKNRYQYRIKDWHPVE